MSKLAIIVCMTKDYGIGLNGTISWHVPEDLRRFKLLTSGHTVIMGRRTYESIGKPLLNRRNIVISASLFLQGCEVVPSLAQAMSISDIGDLPFVIGGHNLYAEALPIASHLYLTKIDRDITTDIFFPPINYNKWLITHSQCGPSSDIAFIDIIRKI